MASLMSGFSMALDIAGLANDAAASYVSSTANKAAFELQAATDRNNSILADYQAKDALARGKQAQDQYRRDIRSAKGSLRAHQAASGVEVNSGSALDVMAGIDAVGAQDEYTLGENARREAMGYKIDALNSRNNAGLQSFAASNEHPGQAAFSTLLGGASQVADRWYQRSRVGAV